MHHNFTLLIKNVFFISSIIGTQQVIGQNQIKNSQVYQSATFTEIRNKAMTQLIGASEPGINVNYNQDKAVLGINFTAVKAKPDTKKPIYLQIQSNIGTTTTLYTLGESTPQPDYSLMPTLTAFTTSNLYYDGTFSTNYPTIQAGGDLSLIQTNAGFHYRDKLKEKLTGTSPKIKPNEPLITAMRFNWFSFQPELGGSRFTFFDNTRSYANQIYKPYYNLFGININFNHYWYVNNDDVEWKGFPVTRFFYYKINVRYGTNNNTDVLKKSSVNDITSTIVDPATGATRQVVKNATAYTGIYEDYTAFSPSFEVLYSCANVFAFDFFGNYYFITSQGNVTKNNGNIAGGLYFNSSGAGSKFNIGIYYQHTMASGPTKNIIGLKTKIPITTL